MEIGACLPTEWATDSILFNSEADSTLKQRTPTSSARLISIVVFATPEKTHLSAVPPAASTRSNSPMETMSKPAPIFANIFNTAKLEFALTA
ncbi:hypothetical protein BBROOKSOX_188 [Bathymodiolus brooksi thiotrophic gill symbiont]|nr:hypothetical protein BBROOKSOX_188 [Bathymodiolus brooksi thiotrophic gill symbiont]